MSSRLGVGTDGRKVGESDLPSAWVLPDLNDRRTMGHRKAREGDKLGRRAGRGEETQRALWCESTKRMKDTENYTLGHDQGALQCQATRI